MSVRRTWDKEAYAAKAKERLEEEDEEDDGSYRIGAGGGVQKRKPSYKEEFLAAEEGAAGPAGSERAYIKARENRVDLDSKVGKTTLVTPALLEAGGGAGFYCETCCCTLKDSTSYLDHINGKKHQRALGFSMRVERVGVDAVRNRMETIKRKMEEAKTRPLKSALEEHTSKVALQVAEEEANKRRRKEEATAAKKRSKEEAAAAAGGSGEGGEEDEAEEDSEMAAMMGFGGFGTTKKK